MHLDEMAIYNACVTNCYKLIEIKKLLKSGADVNTKHLSGRAPLHWTAENNNVELTLLLLGNKANTEVTNATGQTPLHLAVYYCSHDVIKCLLEAGADTKAQDCYGSTPLDLAASNNCKYCKDRLVEAAAPIHSGNQAGLTPSQLVLLSDQRNPDKYLSNNCQPTRTYLAILPKPSPREDNNLKTKKNMPPILPYIDPNSLFHPLSSLSHFSNFWGNYYAMNHALAASPSIPLKREDSSQVTSSRKLA